MKDKPAQRLTSVEEGNVHRNHDQVHDHQEQQRKVPVLKRQQQQQQLKRQKNGQSMTTTFGGICHCFGAVTGAPIVMDGRYTLSRHRRGR